MLKLLFIAHSFHKKTKSNLFFAEILKENFEVTEIYLGPDRYDLDTSLFDLKVDLVVLWQLDYLAPIFINKGIRTLVAPMYDASANLLASHWQLSQGAYFLSFSLSLHRKITEAGCESFLAKFFPENESSFVKDYSSLKAFWWMRQTGGSLNLKTVLSRWGKQLTSLHIHLVPDNPNANLEKIKKEIQEEIRQEENANIEISLSSWFDSEQEMFRVMDSCNVYIAPRASEGIGMGFLKAMSRGMIALAHDSPTHNEYIAHGVNGYLFKDKDTEEQEISQNPELIGKLARITGARGREEWLSQVQKLLDFIKTIPEPTSFKGYLNKKSYARISNAYFRGAKAYDLVLKEELPKIFAPKKDKVGNQSSFPVSVSALIPSLSTDMVYGFGERAVRQFFYGGWSRPEKGKNWIAGREASLCFSFSSKKGLSYRLKFVGRTTLQNFRKDQKPLVIYLNQKKLFSQLLTDKYMSYELTLPGSAFKESEPNVCRFECHSLMYHEALGTSVSCAFDSLEFKEEAYREVDLNLEESYIKEKLSQKKSSLVSKIRNLI